MPDTGLEDSGVSHFRRCSRVIVFASAMFPAQFMCEINLLS